jgi:hypothetical protein
MTFRSFTEHDVSEEMLKLIPHKFYFEVTRLDPVLWSKGV